MIKERYVSFEVAKLLRDKGFDEPCARYYNSIGKLNFLTLTVTETNSGWVDNVSAPTQAVACDWVEERYGIFIQINRYHQYYEGREVTAMTKEDKERGHMTMYYTRVFDKHSVSNTTKHYDTIESAYNEALKHVLTNLM